LFSIRNQPQLRGRLHTRVLWLLFHNSYSLVRELAQLLVAPEGTAIGGTLADSLKLSRIKDEVKQFLIGPRINAKNANSKHQNPFNRPRHRRDKVGPSDE
jgi:hypothetical protein